MVLHCIKWRDAKSRKGRPPVCSRPSPLCGKYVPDSDRIKHSKIRNLFKKRTIMGILQSISNFFRPAEDSAPEKLPGRNESCWCGSGKKYKKCHIHEDEKKLRKKYESSCSSSA
jgi:hypothetical protein